jgi:hypothetical protein
MILAILIDDLVPIHFPYFSLGGKLAVMEPDRRNLLQYFDDPSSTWGGLIGGLAVLFLLLAGITSWDLIVPAFHVVFGGIPPIFTGDPAM